MEPIPTQRFLEWAATRRIVRDARYHPPQCLIYASTQTFARFWVVPKPARSIPLFISHLFDALDPWLECYLWPRGGVWTHSPDAEREPDQVRSVLLNACCIPPGLDGAVRYPASEREQVLTAVFTQLTFGWSVTDDLFVVPDHGRQMILTDHHGVVHAQFLDQRRIEPFVRDMREQGYPPPVELPDETFKKPDWMS